MPLKRESVDIIAAHFSLYTIADRERRKKIMSGLIQILKPRGLMVIVNPSLEYSAKKIIRESVQRVQEHKGVVSAWAKKLFLYPLTTCLGLNFIEKQLKAELARVQFQGNGEEMESAGADGGSYRDGLCRVRSRPDVRKQNRKS